MMIHSYKVGVLDYIIMTIDGTPLAVKMRDNSLINWAHVVSVEEIAANIPTVVLTPGFMETK
jgi:hypothetical protein